MNKKEEGIIIVGYKLTFAGSIDYYNRSRYQLDYQLKLNVDGKINYDYGITFHAEENGFYPSGGSTPASSEESDNILIDRIMDAFCY